jgi:crotonobetainyl-CoA:carnitine CoA-transferase CaiB-like acyl-CoA transferase
MLGALTALVASEPYEAMERCGAAIRTGQTDQRLAPFGVYPTRDGHVAICAYTDGFARSLFKVMQKAELGLDERFRTRDMRVVNYRELDTLIGEWTALHATAEVVAKLEAVDIPTAGVRDPKAAVRDPRVVNRNETVLLSHPKYGAVEKIHGMGLPVKFSRAAAGFDQPPPELGEHNQAVYGGILGYSTQQIEELRTDGVI